MKVRLVSGKLPHCEAVECSTPLATDAIVFMLLPNPRLQHPSCVTPWFRTWSGDRWGERREGGGGYRGSLGGSSSLPDSFAACVSRKKRTSCRAISRRAQTTAELDLLAREWKWCRSVEGYGEGKQIFRAAGTPVATNRDPGWASSQGFQGTQEQVWRTFFLSSLLPSFMAAFVQNSLLLLWDAEKEASFDTLSCHLQWCEGSNSTFRSPCLWRLVCWWAQKGDNNWHLFRVVTSTNCGDML